MTELATSDREVNPTSEVFVHCLACGDVRPVAATTRHCLCGRTCAREVGDEVLVCGPGRVSRAGVLVEDRDEAPVRRPTLTPH